MRSKLILLLCLGCLLTVAFPAAAAHTRATLLLSADAARPGETVLAGIRLQMDSKWHTYWKNSGDSGLPTEVNWELPSGVTAGEIQWPPPVKLVESDLTTYIYKDEAFLLVPLKLDPSLGTGPLQLKAKVSWLECDVQCVPGSANIAASLSIGPETKSSTNSALLQAWAARIPQPAPPAFQVQGRWDGPPKADTRPIVISWTPTAAAAAEKPDFLPYPNDNYEVQATTEILAGSASQIQLRKQVKNLGTNWPTEITGVLIQTSDTGTSAWEVRLHPDASLSSSLSSSSSPDSLWKMLLYAFIGGLILNLMPCVLPVIALKILGFVSQAQQDAARVRRLGLIYGLGVLASFAVLAAFVIALKAAGKQVAWGMQFSNAQFLVVLTSVVTLVALNLFGLFEVTMAGRVMDTAGRLSGRHGASGAFFNGVFTTILATPCTAPALGAAVGFALNPARTAPMIVLVLLTVGVGLALPYVLLSWNPAWLKYLPKPGAWMENFKIAMGFPMLATACWLFSLAPTLYGDRAWWLTIFLVILAAAAWVYGRFFQASSKHRPFVLVLILVLVTLGVVGILEHQLDWRRTEPPPATTANGSTPLPPDFPPNEPGGVPWQPWSSAAIAAAQAESRPVLVDFTAKWCLTCNTIVKPALESASVRKRLKELNAVALLGDYTRFPPAMTEELNRHGRAGVPLVLVYPPKPAAPPIVLPEAFTPGIVLDALNRATH